MALAESLAAEGQQEIFAAWDAPGTGDAAPRLRGEDSRWRTLWVLPLAEMTSCFSFLSVFFGGSDCTTGIWCFSFFSGGSSKWKHHLPRDIYPSRRVSEDSFPCVPVVLDVSNQLHRRLKFEGQECVAGAAAQVKHRAVQVKRK